MWTDEKAHAIMLLRYIRAQKDEDYWRAMAAAISSTCHYEVTTEEAKKAVEFIERRIIADLTRNA